MISDRGAVHMILKILIWAFCGICLLLDIRIVGQIIQIGGLGDKGGHLGAVRRALVGLAGNGKGQEDRRRDGGKEGKYSFHRSMFCINLQI